MSILTVANLAKSFGSRLLFSEINFTLAPGQKMGLIGRNGGGKTTLLKILLGQELPDTSTNPPSRVALAPGRRMGYLRQEAPVHPEHTIAQEIEEALAPLRAAQARVQDAEHAMSDATSDAALEAAMTEYTAATDAFEHLGGWAVEMERDATLIRLGFGPQELQKQVGSCSGGEQTRLALAKLVLTRPDLLILDEPTNHLDINATEWLEGFLKEYEGAVLLVSHDRYFLDAVTDTTAELEFGKLAVYKGNYSHFRRQKEEAQAAQAALHVTQQKEVARLENLISRNMGANATMSRIRHKTQGRIDRMDKVGAVRLDKRAVRANIDTAGAGRIGREVVRISGLTRSYGARTLFAPFNAVIERDDRVGLVGPNGAGKTTLVKLLLGEEEPSGGSIDFGHNVRHAYFSQHATDALDTERTVLETLVEAAKDFTDTQARNYLARFLFTGDDVFKKVSMLSGGEKNKLALARMLLVPCNFLILDEPTNHLDMASCETLTELLLEYKGTLLLVSHDRYLLNAVTNKTLGLTGTGEARLIEGNYAAWREETTPKAVKQVESAPKPATQPLSREANKARARAQAAVEKAEAKVQTLEAKLAEIEHALSTGAGDQMALATQHTDTQTELDEAMKLWEEAVAAAS